MTNCVPEDANNNAKFLKLIEPFKEKSHREFIELRNEKETDYTL